MYQTLGQTSERGSPQEKMLNFFYITVHQQNVFEVQPSRLPKLNPMNFFVCRGT
jgi:hypothetical protein